MRVRLVVVELVLVVGQEVSVVVLQILEVLAGCPVPRILWVLVGPAMLGFFALVFAAVALVRLVHPGAALRSLLQLFPCCSPAKVGSLQHTVVRLSVVAVVFATFFPPWSHQASWAGPDPMYHQRVPAFLSSPWRRVGSFSGGRSQVYSAFSVSLPLSRLLPQSCRPPSVVVVLRLPLVVPGKVLLRQRVVVSSRRCFSGLRVCGFTVCSSML